MSKKNNTAQKSALEIEQLSKALREGTEKTLRNLLKEAIEDIVDNDEKSQDAEPIEDDSYEVQDVETDETPSDAPEEGEPETSGEGEEASSDDEGGADEWGDYDEFKVGDNEYDFTGVDGDLALKIYQALSDDDQISVKKDDEGNIKVSDGETGAGVVIELTPEDGGAENGEEGISDELPGDELHGDEGAEGDVNGDIDIELEPDAEGGADDDEIEIDLGDGLDDEPSDDELNEDLGYTDSYQKDVMPGLKMNEPADKKATYSMDAGAPEGNKKPWAGKHTEKDYKETHTDLAEGCEGGTCESELEENKTTSKAPRRRMPKTDAPNSGETDKPEVSKEVSVAGQLTEAKALKILEAAKAIQAENKQIKALAGKLRKSLMEAATLNMNYGKIVTLLVNESTTKAEKQSIIERFSNVTTVKEGAILFESIKRELNESHKSDAANVLNEQISAESSRQINETTFYQTSANNKSISLMERMDNLGRNYSKGGYKPINENTSKGLDLMNRMSGLQTKRQV